MMPRAAALLSLLTLFAVTGCDRTDPYQREGTWRPSGANDANLRAMVTVPSDLVSASPASRPDGGMAAAAVARLRHGQVHQLPDSGIAQIMISGGPAQPAAAAAPAAAQ